MKSRNYLNNFVSIFVPIVIVLYYNKILIPKGFAFEKALLQFLSISAIVSIFPNFIFLIFALLALIFCLAFSFHSSIFSSLPTKEVIFTVLDTNALEGAGFFQTYLNFHFVALVILSFIIFFILRSKLKFRTHRAYFVIPLIAVVMSLFLFNKKTNLRTTFGVFYHLQEYQIQIQKLNELLSKKITFDLIKMPDIVPAQKIIVLIGESTSRHHMSLYGYERETNPLLKRENLVILNDAISPHAYTNESIKKLLSFSSHDDPNALFDKGDIIDLSRSAGYKTIWISNQSALTANDSSSSFFAKKSDRSLYTLKKYSHDELILPLLKDALSSPEKAVIFVHLVGTHFPYADRYPENFNLFKDGKNKIVDHYDNAVLYNDFVVASVINTLKNFSNTAMVYFSDHGEEVYEIRDFHGHAEEIATHYMFDIPYIFWFSEDSSLKEFYNYKDSYSKMSIETQNFIHDFHFLLGVNGPHFDSKKSFLSKDYIPNLNRKMGKFSYTNIIHAEAPILQGRLIDTLDTIEAKQWKKATSLTQINDDSFYVLELNPKTLDECLNIKDKINHDRVIVISKDIFCLGHLSEAGYITAWTFPQSDIDTVRKRAVLSDKLKKSLSENKVSYLLSSDKYLAFIRKYLPTVQILAIDIAIDAKTKEDKNIDIIKINN